MYYLHRNSSMENQKDHGEINKTQQCNDEVAEAVNVKKMLYRNWQIER